MKGKGSTFKKDISFEKLEIGIASGCSLIEDESISKFSDMFEDQLKFCQLCKFLKKHKDFIFNRDIPQTTYQCKICENIVFVSKALNRNLKFRDRY